MEDFRQKRFLQWTIVLLIIMNVGALSLLWLGRPGPGQLPPLPNHEETQVRQILKEKLGFTDEQIRQYLRLRQNHKNQVQAIQEEINTLKREMFNQVLARQTPASISDSLLNLVLVRQAELEKITFQHFLELKELCGPGQKEKLRVLIREVFRPQGPPLPEQRHPDRQGPPPPERGRP